MLHADQIDAGQVERVFGRQVVGVQVIGHDFGGDREQSLQVFDAAGEG
jgi:hypothetical protein